MKILLVSPLPPPSGGIATWTEKYLLYCKSNSIDVSVVNIALNGRRGKQINTKKNVFDEIIRTFRILRDLKQKIKEFSPDVVHINTSCSRHGIFRDYLCLKILNKNRIPVVLQCHCDVKNYINNSILKKIFSKMAIIPDRILVLNKQSLEFVNKCSETQVTIVPNFVDSSMIDLEYEVRKEMKEILFVGRVQKSKGCIEIIEAAKRLPEYHFTLVGTVIKGFLSENCSSNVSFVGEKDCNEIKEYLLAADALISPSYSEGFSLSLTEAMAVGLPCIATDVGANADMLENTGGVIIPIKNVDSLVKAIRSIESEDVRKRMSCWNKQKVKESYLIDRGMGMLLAVYKTVTGKE